MKLVTLVHAQFHRIGSATRGGFSAGNHRALEITQEIADDEPQTLREFVISVAEKNGEHREALTELKVESSWGKSVAPVIFNIQSNNTFYSTSYAECRTFPAMEFEGRYFRLDEIKLSSRTPTNPKNGRTSRALPTSDET